MAGIIGGGGGSCFVAVSCDCCNDKVTVNQSPISLESMLDANAPIKVSDAIEQHAHSRRFAIIKTPHGTKHVCPNCLHDYSGAAICNRITSP